MARYTTTVETDWVLRLTFGRIADRARDGLAARLEQDAPEPARRAT